jgi:hypothetical protein
VPNSSRLYRYNIFASDGTTAKQVLVRADVSASTLILAGQANAEPSTTSAPNRLRLIIQGRGGPKAKVSYARSVAIVMTGSVAPLSVGSRVIVPVFQVGRFNSYAIGATGTYLGAACQCIAKTDGIPDVRGRGLG